MEDKKPKIDDNPLKDIMFGGQLSILLRIVPTTLSIIAVCAGAGYLIDQEIGSSPVGLIIGLVVAFPVLQYSIYKQTKSLINSKLNNKK